MAYVSHSSSPRGPPVKHRSFGWLFGCTCYRRGFAGGQGTGSSGLVSESDGVTLKFGRLDGLMIINGALDTARQQRMVGGQSALQ